jgi:hypothetical protein
MRRQLLLGVLLLVPLFSLAACGGGSDGSSGGASANSETSGDEVVVELPEVEGSGESGTATLTAMGDQTRVVLELMNPTTPSQPAHIHEGRCGPSLNPEPLHGLVNTNNGRSETVVNRPLSELTAGGLAINVHESASALEVYVACGNLPGGGDNTASSDDGRFDY